MSILGVEEKCITSFVISCSVLVHIFYGTKTSFWFWKFMNSNSYFINSLMNLLSTFLYDSVHYSIFSVRMFIKFEEHNSVSYLMSNLVILI